MDSKQMQIKSHGWHKVTLTDDLLTGDTFAAKDMIVKHLAGKWDSSRKGYVVDLVAVARYTRGENVIQVI